MNGKRSKTPLFLFSIGFFCIFAFSYKTKTKFMKQWIIDY